MKGAGGPKSAARLAVVIGCLVTSSAAICSSLHQTVGNSPRRGKDHVSNRPGCRDVVSIVEHHAPSSSLRSMDASQIRSPLRLHGGFQAVAFRQPENSEESLLELYRSCLEGSATLAFSRASDVLKRWATTAVASLVLAEALRVLFAAILQRVWERAVQGNASDAPCEIQNDLSDSPGVDEDGESAAMLAAARVPDQGAFPAEVAPEHDFEQALASAQASLSETSTDDHRTHVEDELIAELSRLDVLRGSEDDASSALPASDLEAAPRDEQETVPDTQGLTTSNAVDEMASQVSSAESAEIADQGRSEQTETGTRARDGRRGNSVLEDVFGDQSAHDVMAQAETPPGLTTELMTHQKMALGWMQRREEAGRLAATWWEQVDGGMYGYDAPLWVNLLTGQDRALDNPPMEARGGILADDMGLGKTLTILALIVSDVTTQLAAGDPARARASASEADGAEEARQAGGSGSQQAPPVSEQEKRPTLIVCPLSVLHNWQSQIAAHTNEAIQVLVYHGATRTRDLAELSRQHIVLTTYSVLQSDMRCSRGREDGGTRASPLHGVEWRRVVLDEAHVIANPKAKQSKAVMMLHAERRWAVTGTPLQNKIDDLSALFTFVRIEPLDDIEWFRRLVGDPSRSKCARRQAEGLQVVKSVLAEYCLRRTKDQRICGTPIMALPDKSEIVRRLQLSCPERSLYDQLFQSGRAMFRTYMREGSVMTHYTKILERLLRSPSASPLSLPPLSPPPINQLLKPQPQPPDPSTTQAASIVQSPLAPADSCQAVCRCALARSSGQRRL
jgi:hypothetical protein